MARVEMLDARVKPEIEAFDLSMIFKAVEMQKRGKIKGPLHVQFVMGVKNAMPVDRKYSSSTSHVEAACTGRDLDRGGHRPRPDHTQSLVARARRSLPHRPGRQCTS